MKTALHLLSGIALLTCTVRLQAQSSPPRHALIMGVGDYTGTTYKGRGISDLPGITTADLPRMPARLESFGCAVTVVENTSDLSAP